MCWKGHYDALFILTFVIWLWRHTCEWPHYNHKHALPPLACLVLGCQHSGSALHGGQRAVPGNRWWWPSGRAAGHRGRGHSESAAELVALAGWEQAKSWCRVFSSSLEQTALVWKEKLHPQHNAEEKWKVASCCVVVQVLHSSQFQTCCHHMDIFQSWLYDFCWRTVEKHNFFSLSSGNSMDVLAWILQEQYIDDWLFKSNHADMNPSYTWLDKLSIHWASGFLLVSPEKWQQWSFV